MPTTSDHLMNHPTATNPAASYNHTVARPSNPSPQYMDNVLSRFGHHLSPNQIRSMSFVMTSVKSSNSGGVVPMLATGAPSNERETYQYFSGPPAINGAIINIAR
ncbi:hypothetical protein INT44_001924 [Umbelopsis vinacea]|uniref:Uncharacterized protein n=1 Tax=Umbelopsis vinacea TaxID=44442 RepID=A0A8H7Q4Z1_9FUNG|nr:hypothetical protein INT44_001924 [Umbelopsis vinacea]